MEFISFYMFISKYMLILFNMGVVLHTIINYTNLSIAFEYIKNIKISCYTLQMIDLGLTFIRCGFIIGIALEYYNVSLNEKRARDKMGLATKSNETKNQ